MRCMCMYVCRYLDASMTIAPGGEGAHGPGTGTCSVKGKAFVTCTVLAYLHTCTAWLYVSQL